MSTPTKVVEDGLSPPATKKPGGPRWAWFASGLILGLGFSYVMSNVQPIPTPPVSSSTDPLDAPSGVSGISDVIPDFPDGLVAVSSSDGRTLEFVTWPVSSSSYFRPVPLSTDRGPDPISFNSSGRRIATLRAMAGETTLALYAGLPDSVSLAAVEVTGYAWHDSNPAALVFSTLVDGRFVLWRLKWGGEVPQRVGSLDFEGAVVGWGDWGFALQDSGAETITVIDENGELIGSAEGRFLGSHQKGLIALYDGEVVVIAPTGHLVSGAYEFANIGEPRMARFSSDAEMMAVQGAEGVAVITTVYGFAVAGAEFRPGVPAMAWSSDDRFVISTSLRGAVVLDLSDGATFSVLNYPTYGVAAIPLSE